MAVKYTRQFHYGDTGSDVEGVGRALCRAHVIGNTKLLAFQAMPGWMRRKWGPRKQADLKRFKQKVGLKADSVYTKTAHAKLEPYFDAKARQLMNAYQPPSSQSERQWRDLVAAMKAVHAQTPGYRMSGSHGVKLSGCRPDDWFDCSSSCSYVLYEAGMFPHEYALDSGGFTSWGEHGRGQYFTVWAKAGAGALGHVWIQIHRHTNPLLPYWRFDTSPQGDPKSPKSGARLRFSPRFTSGFTPRHWSGM